MKKLKVVRYEKQQKSLWDEFIGKSKNGTFLFYRDYMEYHSGRFTDFSLMFFDDDRVIAVMPANIDGDTVFSHGGLTYGGIVSDQKMKTPIMVEILNDLKEYLKNQGIKKLIYKAIPHIYHTSPADEDLYALFFHDAALIRRDVSSAIFMKERIELDSDTNYQINKSKKCGFEIKRSYDFKSFMSIMGNILQKKYGVNPVHTVDEIQLLANRFPENIKLFALYKDNTMIAGTIMYESKNVAHAQYNASTDEGRKLYAMYFIFDALMAEYYKDKKYLDFGISTENNGRYLNQGLIKFKERFGARAVIYDFYEMRIH